MEATCNCSLGTLVNAQFPEDSPESVDLTIKELEENLKQAVNAATGSARKKLAHAKVVGMACDVSEPLDVRKLGKFAADELGYIDIWVSNFLLFTFFASTAKESEVHI